MKVKNIKPILLKLPYLAFVYLFDKLCQAFRLSIRDNVLDTFLSLGEGFAKAFETFAPSFHPIDLTVSVFGTGLIVLVMYVRGLEARKYRKGKEYGSARWGNAEDIAPYIDPVFENNVLLTNTERLMMSSRPSHPKYARNKNVLVVGGSGSGKTRFFVKPNLMQMHSSYVVTDPKGTVLIECGKMLQRAGYKIKVLNTINFKKSMHYNPFAYIHNETDILKLVNTLIENTKGDGEKSGEDFWVKAEKLYYCALIGYIHYEAPESEKNISTLLDMINASEAREDDEDFQNPVDLMFERLEEKEPEHFAVKQYKKYKLAAGKTAKSILISCGARLAPFDIKELRELMETDEMELDTLGDRKTALFIISSDTNSTFDFVNALICSQLFNVLCTKADDVYGGRLPVHVRCLLDEFANIKIPDMQRLIAVLRSREISCSLVVQSQSQLKAIYKDRADTIVGNCDTMLFLGGKEKTTLKEISEILGKETIDSFNKSENRGREVSHGLNFQKLGKELMTQDEIATMDGSKCILQVRGVRPFLSDKFDITAHPNYKYLSDFDKKNAFDPEKVEYDTIATRQATLFFAEPTEAVPVKPIIPSATDQGGKLKEITDRLEQGIADLFNSDRFKEYLNVMSKFHNYSFNNTVLIALQKPDASLVIGFNAWKGKGIERSVKKGEQGIRIFAPAPYKIKTETEKIDPDTKKPVIGEDGKPITEIKEITVPAFKVVCVYDVSQTEGKELPTLGTNELLGNVENCKNLFAALEKASPVPIAFEQIAGGAHGYYHLEDKRIALDEGMSELQTLKTAIHEIAHAKLHDIDLNASAEERANRPDKHTREVEAESVAYTVCQHYGLDTSDYSFRYVAGWSSGREMSELKSPLETIRRAAAKIIDSIDAHLAEIQKEREAEAPGLDPKGEPTVTIIWSENGKLRDGETMPLSRANALFEALDAQNKDTLGYDKTKFRLDFTLDGKPEQYEGRQDLGDGEGSLIDHIEKFNAYYLNNEEWQNSYCEAKDAKLWKPITPHASFW